MKGIKEKEKGESLRKTLERGNQAESSKLE